MKHDNEEYVTLEELLGRIQELEAELEMLRTVLMAMYKNKDEIEH